MQLDQLDPRIVGQRLTDARKSRGITQDDAAKRIEKVSKSLPNNAAIIQEIRKAGR